MGWIPEPLTPLIEEGASGEIGALTEKASPVDADRVLLEDSEDASSYKYAQVGNLPGGGGGGGGGDVPEWVSYFAARQADETAHADDQFWSTGAPSTPAGGTELTVSGTATWLEGRSRLSVKAQGQSAADAAARIYSLTPSTPPVTIETAVRIQIIAEGAASNIAFGFADGNAASDNLVSTALALVNGTDGIFFAQLAGTFTNRAGDVNNNLADTEYWPFGTIYMRCIWSASNTFKTLWSPDGLSWTDYGGGSSSKTMTPDRFALWVSTNSNSEIQVGTFEYVRVYEADLS